MADDSYLKFMLASKKGGNDNNSEGGVSATSQTTTNKTSTNQSQSLPSQLSSILKNYQQRYNNQVVVPIQVEMDNGLVLLKNMGVVGTEIKTLLSGLVTISRRIEEDDEKGATLGFDNNMKYQFSLIHNQYETSSRKKQLPLNSTSSLSNDTENSSNYLLLSSFKSTLSATLKKLENLIIALRKCVKEIDLYVDRGGRLLDKCMGSFVGFGGFGDTEGGGLGLGLEVQDDKSDSEDLMVDEEKEELYGSIQPSSISPKTNNTQQQQTYNMTAINTKILSDMTAIQTGFINNLYFRQELVDLVISKAGDLLVSSSNSNEKEEGGDSNIDIRNLEDGGEGGGGRESDVREWEEVLRLIRKCEVDWGSGERS